MLTSDLFENKTPAEELPDVVEGICTECGGPAFSDLILAEKQDACYNKVKSRYKVWPSAYASGALVQCRKKGAANWGNKSEGVNEMDKSQTPPGRSGASPDSGKEYTAKPIKAKDFAKDAGDQWIKNLSKDQLDAIAGPRYKKKGVAEGSGDISSMIQQYEDMVELVYDLPPGRKKNIAIDRRDALEAQIEAMPGGKEALRQWAKSYNDAMDEGVAEGFKNTYSVGDRVDGPLGTGTIVAVSKNINVDGRVKVKLDDPSRAGEDGKYKDSFVLDTTQLKHINEQDVAEGLPQTLRKFVPGYAKREIDKKMDAEKFGRTDVDKDVNYYRYKKIQDKLKEQGVAEGAFDNYSPLAQQQIAKDKNQALKNTSADEVIRDLIQGSLDGYDVMAHPRTPAQKVVAKMMQDKYDDIAINHRLHPDDDFEEIISRVIDDFEEDYGAGLSEGSNDYFKRRKDEEDRIAGVKAPAKRTPKQTDYEKRRKQQSVTEVSKASLDRYVEKAVDAHGHANFSARMSKDDPSLRSYHKSQAQTAEKRRRGISRALDRMSKTEDVTEEQLSEQDLAEAVSTLELADFLFKGLEQKFPKVVERYGHEVVGDAIMDVAEENQDVNSVSDVDMLIDDIIEKLQNYSNSDSGLSESKVSRLYYNVVGTSAPELRKDFGMRRDSRGWFLSESSGRNRIMDAHRAFGSPKLVEYDLSVSDKGAATLGPDNVVSPIGTVPRGQQLNKKAKSKKV